MKNRAERSITSTRTTQLHFNFDSFEGDGDDVSEPHGHSCAAGLDTPALGKLLQELMEPVQVVLRRPYSHGQLQTGA